MERLTMRNETGMAFWVDHRCVGGGYRMTEDKKDQDHLDRLASYEDTMPLERAQELARAEKDGRLVVLPCKVGDTVWTNIAIVGDRYKSADRPYPVEVVFIGMGKDDRFFHVQYESGTAFPFNYEKFGKTVFLTREEAEAALKKREDADNEAD